MGRRDGIAQVPGEDGLSPNYGPPRRRQRAKASGERPSLGTELDQSAKICDGESGVMIEEQKAQRKKRDEDSRSRSAVAAGAFPPAPPETIEELVRFLGSRSKHWTKTELIARAALRFPTVPKWQFADAVLGAGIEIRKSNLRCNEVKEIRDLLPSIVREPEQSAELLVARVRELVTAGQSVARASRQAGLEFPDVQAKPDSMKSAAVAAWLNPQNVAVNVTLGRTLASIVLHEQARLDRK